jgi:hypothetical protein
MSRTPTPDSESPATPAREILANPDQAQDRIARLAEAARHEIQVFAPQLDARLFNGARLAAALAHFVARHGQNRARVLVEDGAQALRDNERIVELARRFSEFVDLREVGEAHRGLREVFVVADRAAYLHQQDITRPTCIVDPAGRREAVVLAGRFESMWEQSLPVPGLRAAGL